MTNAALFRSASLELESSVNALRNRYTFTIVSTASIQEENRVVVTFPDQCLIPEGDDISCKTSTKDYIDDITCTKIEDVDNQILIEFELEDDIPPLETLSFSIDDIMNPNSTRPSDPIAVHIFETSALESVKNRDSGTLIATTSIPHSLDGDLASLTPSMRGAG